MQGGAGRHTGLSARRARRTKSGGPKGLQLKVGARKAPRLLVNSILLYPSYFLDKVQSSPLARSYFEKFFSLRWSLHQAPWRHWRWNKPEQNIHLIDLGLFFPWPNKIKKQQDKEDGHGSLGSLSSMEGSPNSPINGSPGDNFQQNPTSFIQSPPLFPSPPHGFQWISMDPYRCQWSSRCESIQTKSFPGSYTSSKMKNAPSSFFSCFPPKETRKSPPRPHRIFWGRGWRHCCLRKTHVFAPFRRSQEEREDQNKAVS